MNQVVAVCPEHGPFPSQLLSLGDGSTVEGLHLKNNREQCPKCGHRARTMEGSFNIRAGVVEILSAPEWTQQALREVAQAAETARAALQKAENSAAIRNALADLQRQVSKQSAMLGDLLAHKNAEILKAKKTARRNLALGVAGFLVTAATWYISPTDVHDFVHSTIVAPTEDAIQQKQEQSDTADDHKQTSVVDELAENQQQKQHPKDVAGN